MVVRPAYWLRVVGLLALSAALMACGAVAGMGKDGPHAPSTPASVPADADDRSGEDGSGTGDADQGARLFDQPIGDLPSCSTCHALDESRVVGPGLGDVAERAGQNVAGQSAEAYLRESIVEPGAYVVEGYMDVMPHGYGDQMNDVQLRDLVAYLLTLGR